MSEEYTPSTDEVRASWLVDNSRKEAVKAGPVLDGFDRWLAEEKRAAAEKAWGDCARAIQDGLGAWDAYEHNPYRKEEK